MDIAERTLQLKSDIDEAYEAGKKAEHNEFWDNISTTSAWKFAGTAWNKNTFKPNKNFTVGSNSFYYHNYNGTAYDLSAQLEELGVTMSLNSEADTQTFMYAYFSRLPKLDFSKCSGVFDRVFNGCSQLVTIDKIIFAEGKVTSFSSPFSSCTKLKNITFEGVLDKSISFSPCPLSVASIKSIILALKQFDSYTYTLTLKSSAFAPLEAEGATAEYNGVACTWAELIDNKKWNLTLA